MIDQLQKKALLTSSLEAKNLCMQFGHKLALNNLSFKVNKDKIFCLLGKIGAGKATTIQRNTFTNWIGLFVPTIHMQFSMNTLCKTDMRNYLLYIAALEQFHEEKRLSFYPKIFNEIPIKNERWDAYKLEYFQDDRAIEWIPLLPMIIICFSLLLLARWRLNCPLL